MFIVKRRIMPSRSYELSEETKRQIMEYINEHHPGFVDFSRRMFSHPHDICCGPLGGENAEENRNKERERCAAWNSGVDCGHDAAHADRYKIYEHVCANCLDVTGARHSHPAVDECCPINDFKNKLAEQ